MNPFSCTPERTGAAHRRRIGARRIGLAAVCLLLAACTARELRCDSRLRPINAGATAAASPAAVPP
jgi:hypothetical protein